jgi:hypothetical protein
MASDIGIGPAQHGRIRDEPGNNEASDSRCPNARAHRRAGGLYDTGGFKQAACVFCGRRQNHCAKGRRAVETAGIIDDPPGGDVLPTVRFARDSALEESGFEPLVPLTPKRERCRYAR